MCSVLRTDLVAMLFESYPESCGFLPVVLLPISDRASRYGCEDPIRCKNGKADYYPDHTASWTVVAHLVETDQWSRMFLDNRISLPVPREEAAVNGLIQFPGKGLYWTYSTCPEQDRRVSAAVAYFLVRDHEIQGSFSLLGNIYRNAAIITTSAPVHHRRPRLTFSRRGWVRTCGRV